MDRVEVRVAIIWRAFCLGGVGEGSGSARRGLVRGGNEGEGGVGEICYLLSGGDRHIR